MRFILLLCLIFCLEGCDKLNPPISRKGIFDGEYYNLINAIADNDTSRIESLVFKYHLDVNHRDKDFGISLLRWALANYKKKAFIKLLNLGASPNFKDSVSPIPVIIYSAAEADIDYLKACLEHSGDPNVSFFYLPRENKPFDINSALYCTPLIASLNMIPDSEKNIIRNINLLIQFGADINYLPKQCSQDYLPLTQAIAKEHWEVAYNLLVVHEANPFSVKFSYYNSFDTLNICKLLKETEKEKNLNNVSNTFKSAIIAYLKEKYYLNCDSASNITSTRIPLTETKF